MPIITSFVSADGKTRVLLDTVPDPSDPSLHRLVVAGAGGVVASDGLTVYPENYAHTLTRNADQTVATDSFNNGTNTYTMTFTYTAGQLTAWSKWVKQ